jgi:hypothetical protein
MCNICHKGVFHYTVGAATQIVPCPNGCRRATPEELDARLENQMQQLVAVMQEEIA